jgi:hypothetical protein
MDRFVLLSVQFRGRQSVITDVFVDHWCSLNRWQFAAGVVGTGGSSAAGVTAIDVNPVYSPHYHTI